MIRLRQYTAIILVALPLAYACKQTESGPVDRVTLANKQSARLASGVDVKMDTIADSRCPINANCIWAGNAIVAASLTKGETKQVRLVLGQDPAQPANKRPDSTGVTLGGETYKVILREVTPYPSLDSKPVQRAVIQVTRL